MFEVIGGLWLVYLHGPLSLSLCLCLTLGLSLSCIGSLGWLEAGGNLQRRIILNMVSLGWAALEPGC